MSEEKIAELLKDKEDEYMSEERSAVRIAHKVSNLFFSEVPFFKRDAVES